MDANLLHRFEALESGRAEMVALVKSYDPGQQNREPARGEMSPAQVLEHFARVERWHLRFLAAHPPKTLVSAKVKHGFVFRREIPKMGIKGLKVPALPMFVPKGVLDVDATFAGWETVRGKIGCYLSDVVDPNAAFIKMPFYFGTLSALDYLRLLELHQAYHFERFPFRA